MVLTRGAVLIMTFLSALLAFVFVDPNQRDWIKFGVLALGLCMAHAVNNILNDVTDFVKKVDTPDYYRNQYAIHALADGHVTLWEIALWAIATGMAALACGLFFIIGQPNGHLAIQLTLAGSFFLLFYTWPLKYIGLGEPAVFAVWGPLMIGGGHAMLTGTSSIDWDVVIKGLRTLFVCLLFAAWELFTHIPFRQHTHWA